MILNLFFSLTKCIVMHQNIKANSFYVKTYLAINPIPPKTLAKGIYLFFISFGSCFVNIQVY